MYRMLSFKALPNLNRFFFLFIFADTTLAPQLMDKNDFSVIANYVDLEGRVRRDTAEETQREAERRAEARKRIEERRKNEEMLAESEGRNDVELGK